MTGQEIKSKITRINATIQGALVPGKFELNAEVLSLRNEIGKLQGMCPHEFQNGKCIYCGKEG